MIWQDLINGIFESGGGILLAINCLRLYRDKRIQGVSIIPTAFFMLWGYWNLYFYPHYGAWVSFFGGIGVVTSNTIWVVMMIHYSRRRTQTKG
jgi:hypothetical protein